MFVALHVVSNRRIASISPEWIGRGAELLRMGREGQLACPGCRQLLWFRRGSRLRRPHFAHRHKTDCNLSHQSPEVLEAKALLYEWLNGKFAGKVELVVELDVDLRIPEWEKFADIIVRRNGQTVFAYWVFDRQQRNRDALLCYGKESGLAINFIHTESAHVRSGAGRLELTASQRDFLRATRFDHPHGHEGHLGFLDTKSRRLSIYRGLYCYHPPNLYQWRKRRTGPLAEALICPKTGEPVFKQDVDAWKGWVEEKTKQRKAKVETAPTLPAPDDSARES